MRVKRKSVGLIWLLNKACTILPVFFWLFLIFGFEEPLMAIITLVSALIHEMGHIGYIMIAKGLTPSIKGVLSGFRIRTGSGLSYDEEIGTYLAGPAVNIFVFVVCSFLAIPFGGIFAVIALINLATALSNLLPIEGYDGYGALMAIISKREMGNGAVRRLSYLSSTLIFLLCILSLYLIDRQGGGYWIFAVFFISMIKCIKNVIRE